MGVALSGLLISWSSAMNTAVSVFVAVLLANAAVFAIGWVVQVVRVPALMHREQEAAIALHASRTAKKDLAERLGRHDELGVQQFWVKHPKTNADVSVWLDGLKQWTETLIKMMEEGGCTYLEVKSVRVLGNLVEHQRRYNVNRKINKALVQLDARRRRLQVVIDRYSNQADGMNAS
jgi:hypothetical protein